jgi:hypothetical protein
VGVPDTDGLGCLFASVVAAAFAAGGVLAVVAFAVHAIIT